MDEKQEKRLREYGVLVLPEKIDEETYELVIDATLIRPHDSISLYCAGAGGSTWDALAIADLIQQHGLFFGLLAGTAASAHLDIWAACQERYIYPNGAIGVHEAGYAKQDGEMDVRGSQSLLEDLKRLNEQIALLYTRASIRDIYFWRNMMVTAGNTGCKWLDADEVIALGMARPIAEYAALTPAPSPDGGGE